MATHMAGQKRKGMTDGVTHEWTLIAKVKPGHEQTLRERASTRYAEFKRAGIEDNIIIPVGTVHDYKWVLFDNDTRLMFQSNFDGDWDAYISDFFATKVVMEGFDYQLSHCEGYPVTGSPDAKREWMHAQTQEAAWYTRAYHGTVKEMWKALEVQKAFQQVLDDPAAVKALTQTPALKPLLDLASK